MTDAAGSTTTGAPASAITTDVLVVGGGPAGAAAAYWLARHGHDVTVVEKKTFPREKTCGDGLTPRAVHQLDDMGLGGRSPQFHRYDGPAGDRPRHRRSSCEWPEHPDLPVTTATSCAAATSTRSSPTNAVAAGATVLAGHRGHRARSSSAGFVRGAVVERRPTADRVEIRAELRRRRRRRQQPLRPGPRHRPRPRVARTARRSAATGRRPRTPSRGSSRRSTSRTATATRCPATAGSSRSATARSTSASACCRRSATSRASTPPTCSTRTPDQIADALGASTRRTRRAADQRAAPDGRIGRPQGRARRYLVVGDAAGTVNPFNGEGIDYAYETGRMAADVLARGARRPATPPRCSATRSCSTTSTASTSRWPGCSPG